MDAPDHYQICVERHLGEALVAHFPGLSITHLHNGCTLIDGDLPDQAALHGLLARIRDLGLVLISVQRGDTAVRAASPPANTRA